MERQPQAMELDLIGQYYASIINPRQTGVFALTVYLKEVLNPQILQEAVNDLMRRLPFLNGRLKRGFLHYKYEGLTEPPQVKRESRESLFCDYYNRDSGHMIGIVCGDRHFTVRTTHSICDGRGLSKVTRALIVRYFELLGVEANHGDIMDCAQAFQGEEAENAYERFVNPSAKSNVERGIAKLKAYHPKSAKSAPQHVLTQVLDSGEMNEKAKAHGVTITAYLLAQIFCEVAKERDAKGDKRPITAMLPIDCRSFFPSKTLRSFVSSETITMPETEDFADMLQQISAQFQKINKDSIQADIDELQNLYHSTRYVPRVLKTWFMKVIARSESTEQTTGLSNLGRITLPQEIACRVDWMEFSISLEQDTPYFFSCVTHGNALAFTASFREEGRMLVDAVMSRLKSE